MIKTNFVALLEPSCIILIKEINQEDNMKHIAAYALLVLSGKDAPTAADVTKVLKDAGVAGDDAKAEALVAALGGKPFHTLVAEGKAALGKMGGSAAPATAAAGGAATAEAAKPAEKEAEPEEDIDMGNLFGGDDDY